MNETFLFANEYELRIYMRQGPSTSSGWPEIYESVFESSGERPSTSSGWQRAYKMGVTKKDNPGAVHTGIERMLFLKQTKKTFINKPMQIFTILFSEKNNWDEKSFCVGKLIFGLLYKHAINRLKPLLK